jgi:addiction module RelB/DinJ family antitoxin
MQSAVINFTTEQKTKKEAQKVAKKMGVSLSMVLNHYLKYFVKTQELVFNVEEEIPNKATQKALKESEEDVKAGRVISFKSGQDALNYLAAEIQNDKKSSSH